MTEGRQTADGAVIGLSLSHWGIQFLPVDERNKIAEAMFWEGLCDKPAGSFLGEYMGILIFESREGTGI